MWGGEWFWKTLGINLWFHMYSHPCGYAYTHAYTLHTNIQALERRHTQTVAALTSLVMSSYGTTLLNMVWHQLKSHHMVYDRKPSGVWVQAIQTHSFFVSDLQVEKSENTEGGKGHLESSHYLITWINQHEPRRKGNSRNTDVCKKVPEVF